MSKINATKGIGSQRGMSASGRTAPRRGELRIGPIRLRRAAPESPVAVLEYAVDVFSQEVIFGWALHESGIREVRVYRDDIAIGEARLGMGRPDVHAAYPQIAGSDRAGFLFPLASHLRAGPNRISLEFEAGDGTRTGWCRDFVRLDLGGPDAPHQFRPGIDLPVRSGLPFEVTGLLRVFRPGIYDGDSGWSDDLMAQAVADLEAIWHSGTGRETWADILFLKTMSQRFRWVGSRFPRFNEKSSHGAKDWDGMMTSPGEMLAIANHLFVLKSHGLDGHFLEFGCFKGFSSSCLSHCCRHLDLPMETFDSFAGLPPSDGDYYSPGEFCGTFEEVSSNLDEFGEPRGVSFHKGFFADTLPHFTKRPVIAIWMDVDLFRSAADVATIFDALPRSSVVFTHEFPTDGAADGRLLPEKSEVFPPILDRLESLGRTPVARHLEGMLGAVWDAAEGIPVLPQGLLVRLANLGE